MKPSPSKVWDPSEYKAKEKGKIMSKRSYRLAKRVWQKPNQEACEDILPEEVQDCVCIGRDIEDYISLNGGRWEKKEEERRKKMIKLDSLRKEEPFYGSSKRISFPRFIYLCVIKETIDKKKLDTLSSLSLLFSLKRSSSRCSNGVVKQNFLFYFLEKELKIIK